MRIEDEIKIAMKSGDKERLIALRSILSDAKNRAIANKTTVSEDDIVATCIALKAEAKEGIAIYANSGEPVAVANYNRNLLLLNVVTQFLPVEMSFEELTVAVKSMLTEVPVTSMKDFGKFMGEFTSKYGKGTFNGSDVQKIVKESIGI